MIRNVIIALLGVVLLKSWCFADIIPKNSAEIPSSSIGVYQVSSSRLVVYSKPDDKSKILYEENLDYSKYMDKTDSPIYCIVLPKKQLSYLYAIDCYDEWVEVICDKKSNTIGWVKKDDNFQFLPWVNFYGMYGRKYGLFGLKKESSKLFTTTVYADADKSSKIISENIQPVKIRLTSIEGNFALVSILDITGTINTGYIEWRTQEGKYFVFPECK